MIDGHERVVQKVTEALRVANAVQPLLAVETAAEIAIKAVRDTDTALASEKPPLWPGGDLIFCNQCTPIFEPEDRESAIECPQWSQTIITRGHPDGKRFDVWENGEKLTSVYVAYFSMGYPGLMLLELVRGLNNLPVRCGHNHAFSHVYRLRYSASANATYTLNEWPDGPIWGAKVPYSPFDPPKGSYPWLVQERF